MGLSQLDFLPVQFILASQEDSTMCQKTEDYEFSRLWPRMGLTKQRVITDQMHIMAKLRSAWSRALNPPPRRTWAIVQLQPAIVGATSMSDTQPIPLTR